jgi:hypothetical protein
MSTDLREVQSVQSGFDSDNWSHQPGFETIRHSTFHLGKLVGKVSTYCEAVEHGDTPSREILDNEVIPDLLIFAARLANDGGLDLEQLFIARTAALRERFSQPHER